MRDVRQHSALASERAPLRDDLLSDIPNDSVSSAFSQLISLGLIEAAASDCAVCRGSRQVRNGKPGEQDKKRQHDNKRGCLLSATTPT